MEAQPRHRQVHVSTCVRLSLTHTHKRDKNKVTRWANGRLGWAGLRMGAWSAAATAWLESSIKTESSYLHGEYIQAAREEGRGPRLAPQREVHLALLRLDPLQVLAIRPWSV